MRVRGRPWRSPASVIRHAAAGGWYATPAGPQTRRPYSRPMEHYTHRVSVPLRQTGSATVDSNGNATVVMAPQGVGARWYVSQVQVRTSSGATDNSAAIVYRDAQLAGHEIGRSDQGGFDTIGVSTPGIQPGDLLIVTWSNGNPADIATAAVYGTQSALM